MKQHSGILKTVAVGGLLSAGSILLASSLSYIPEGSQYNFFDQAQAQTSVAYKTIGTYTAPNGNVYTLLQKTKTVFSFRRSDGTTASKTFRSKLALTSYLKASNSKKGGTITPTPSPVIQKPVPVAPVSLTKVQDLSYRAPSGTESIHISITTKDGIITDASAIPEATRGPSAMYQQGFAENLAGSVIGKAIKGLRVDTISGASLTTGAFNNFLANAAN